MLKTISLIRSRGRCPVFRAGAGATARHSSTELSTGRRRRRRWLDALLLGAQLTLLPVAIWAAGEELPPNGAALVAQATAGDAWAQLNLGAAYDHGSSGFPLDPVRAVRWYRLAAEAGLAEAQFNLAHCLATGNGVVRDDAQSLQWMLKAAEQGLASAQFLAGVMLNDGIGAARDRDAALGWLRRAADNGNRDAAALLERLREDSDRRSGDAAS